MTIEKINQIWPEWTIEKILGRGSFGEVYKAVRKDNNLESYAAIKVISIPQDQSEVDSLRSEGLNLDGTRTYLKGIVNDFVGEIQLMESMKGIQNIVSIEDYKVVEKTDGIGWDILIRMELLTPFNTYTSDRKLSEAEVIKLGIDICTALEICGKCNIIHRDIKPENIFVNSFGYFKLGDFGIARKLENMTGGLSQKGTYNYMAPEVANSSYYDARVDTYSLGIVLYKLLNCNRLPFLDSDKQLLNPNERKLANERRLHGEQLTPPSEASAAMANLILRACAFNPDQRFGSATEMKKALESVQNGAYVAVPLNAEGTVRVRRANTNSAKKAEAISSAAAVRNTHSKAPKKKTGLGRFIVIIIAVVVLGIGIITVPKFLASQVPVETSLAPIGEEATSEESTIDTEVSFQSMENDEMHSEAEATEAPADVEETAAPVEILEPVEKEKEPAAVDTLTEEKEQDAKKERENTGIAGDIAAVESSDIDSSDYNNEGFSVTEENQSIQHLVDILQPYQSNDYEVFSDGNSVMMGGMKRYNGFTLDVYGWNGQSCAIYNVNKAYSKLTGMIGYIDDRVGDGRTWDVTIYADDEPVFTCSVSTGDLPKEFSVDLSDVTKLEFRTGSTNGFKGNIGFAELEITCSNSLEVSSDSLNNDGFANLVDILQPFSSNDYEAFSDGNSVMMGGIERYNGFTLDVYGWNGQSCAIYNLNKAYTKITGITGYVDGRIGDGDTWDVNIYTDDYLAYTCTVSPGDLPQEFSIDLTGVTKLEFRTGLTNGRSGYIGFADLKIEETGSVEVTNDSSNSDGFVNLVDILQPFSSNDYEPFSNGVSVMMGGVKRYNGFTLDVYGWNGQSCAIYNINKAYTKLSGITGYVDGRIGDGNTWDVNIYTDDKLVYTCIVSPNDLPQEFIIDLTDVTKLEFRTGETNGFSGYIGFADLRIY